MDNEKIIKNKEDRKKASEKFRLANKEYYRNYYREYRKNHKQPNYSKLYKNRLDKIIEFINDENTYFEDGENYSNVKHILDIAMGKCD